MSDTLKINIEADIQIPIGVTFLKIRTRRNSIEFDRAVSIADFTDDDLRKIGSKWTEALIERAANIRSMDR